MTSLLAEFASAEALTTAARRTGEQGFAARDVLSPYPLENMDEIVPPRHARIRGPMALAGFGTALFVFFFQWWTAAVAYPFNSGGRPFFSWPVFLLVPVETGVLAAGIAGMIAFFVSCGLPRLYDPVFDVGDIERASQDRFFLLFAHPGDARLDRLRDLLTGAGALQVAEAAE
jgi:hypothetical protein